MTKRTAYAVLFLQKWLSLIHISQDPRPAYQTDPSRVYGLSFAGLTVRFTVQGHSLRVTEITD